MKNRLYVTLFAVAVSGSVTVSATGRDGHGIDHKVWGGRVATAKGPNWEKIAKGDKPHALGDTYHAASHKVGGSPATYAPSEQENFLRRLAAQLQPINPEYSRKLHAIADQIGQLRMHNLPVFTEIFKTDDSDEAEQMVGPAQEDDEAETMVRPAQEDDEAETMVGSAQEDDEAETMVGSAQEEDEAEEESDND